MDNLKAVRDSLLTENIQTFWVVVSPTGADTFLNCWITRVLRLRLEPMKRVARMLMNHQKLIFKGFFSSGQVASGTVEGFNAKARLTARKS